MDRGILEIIPWIGFGNYYIAFFFIEQKASIINVIYYNCFYVHILYEYKSFQDKI